jgi:hypothetical protein
MKADLIEQAVNFAHALWPAWLRAVPDLTDDYTAENEHKLAVPGYSQVDPYSCGATACFAVVRTFHPQANFQKVYSDTNPLPFEGVSERKLVRALRRNGVGVAVRFNLDYQSIRAAIEGGFPLIVGIGNDMFKDGDHWAVIYGIGWNPRRIFISNQPNFGNSREELTWSGFRSIWIPRGRALVCWGKPLKR